MTLENQTEKRLKLLYPEFGDRVRNFILKFQSEHKRQLKITDSLRTFKSQDLLYQKGRTAPGSIVTNAKGGESFHNYGLAVDLCFYGVDPYLEKLPIRDRNYYWEQLGMFGKQEGLFWGGDFRTMKRDLPHFELTYGLKLDQIKAHFNAGGLLNLWAELDKINERPYGRDYIGDYVFYKPIDPKEGKRLT